MAELHPSITLTSLDGLCPTPDFVFQPDKQYDSTASIDTPQLAKFQDINYFTNGRILTSLYVENFNSFSSLPINLYLYQNGSWQAVSWSILNVLQYRYLSMFQSCSMPGKLYVCTSADQEATIPEKSTTSWIYTKVNEMPTSQNINSYRMITTAGDPVIPIASLMLTSADGLNPAYSAVVINRSGNFGREVISGSNQIIQSSTKLLSTSEQLLLPGSQPKTLEERVSDLENKTELLQNQVDNLNTQINTVQSKLSKILSATSTFFVSR